MLLLIFCNVLNIYVVVLLRHYIVEVKIVKIVIDIAATELVNEIERTTSLADDGYVVENCVKHHTAATTRILTLVVENAEAALANVAIVVGIRDVADV